MTDNEKNQQDRPKLTLVPARPAETESYLVTDGIWFRKVRELTEVWQGIEFEGED